MDDARELGREESLAGQAVLQALLPQEILPLFDAAFTRSHLLYDEFVCRLALQVVRESGLEEPLLRSGTAMEIAAQAGLEPGRALVPLDWMLRFLAGRGLLEESSVEGSGRYRSPGPLPSLDPVSIREEQERYEPSWMPAYVLAETVARDYPAFLRGEATGEEVLFSPRRLRLWVDYFSNDNGSYAVNNRLGGIAVGQWLSRAGGVVLELGGGLGSGAIALLERLAALGRLRAVSEYRFTEFVPAFLRRGEQALRARYPALPPLTFAPLDMNRSFDEQGVTPGSVSVVFAVNTLHVAHDLEFTLSEVRRALEPGGCLVASECVRPRLRQPVAAEFIFSLAATFRAPRLQPPYRTSGGFLSPEEWQGALAAAGFSDIRFLPDIARIRDRAPKFIVAAIVATRPA